MKVKEGFNEKWCLNKGLKEGREEARQMPEHRASGQRGQEYKRL